MVSTAGTEDGYLTEAASCLNILNKKYARLKEMGLDSQSVIELFLGEGWSRELLRKSGFLSKTLYEGYILRAYVGSKSIIILMRRSSSKSTDFVNLAEFRYAHGSNLAIRLLKRLIYDFSTLEHIYNLYNNCKDKGTPEELKERVEDPNLIRILQSYDLQIGADGYLVVRSHKEQLTVCDILLGLWKRRTKRG